MNYYESINENLLALLPTNARTVVEVGCSAGRFAAAYQAINPTVRYIGLELDKDVAKKATRQISDVIVGNIEEDNVFAAFEAVLGDAEIDVLVFGDVLEHLIDPWKILSRFQILMALNAYCVACIPNISHWSVVEDLIRGKWNYANSGLLDVTHLRFFTKDSIIALFEKTGWQVETLSGRVVMPNEAEQSFNVFSALAPALGVSPEQIRENLMVYQWVIRAQCV